MYYQNKHHARIYKERGFTIVELLIIIITIGLLVGIFFTTFTDIGRKRRNSERQQDVKTIQHAIEDYYSQKERYPSLAQINDVNWRSKNIKSLSNDDITDPSSKQSALSPAPAAKVYSYAPATTDGAPCDNVTLDCMKYVLTATQEDAEAYAKNNYN